MSQIDRCVLVRKSNEDFGKIERKVGIGCNKVDQQTATDTGTVERPYDKQHCVNHNKSHIVALQFSNLIDFIARRKMSNRDVMEARKAYLEKLADNVERRLKKAPQGTVRISREGTRFRYYHRKTSSDRRGTYIPKSNTKLIRGLAQKDYDQKVIRAAKQEQKAIESYLRQCPDKRPADLDAGTDRCYVTRSEVIRIP